MKSNQILKLCLVAMIMFQFASCKECKCDDEKTAVTNVSRSDVTRPDNMLKYKEIVGILKHYDNTRKNVLEKALGKEDTRVNFYEIQQLKNYIAYVEKLSEDKKIPLTGISIISAAYPDDYKLNPAYKNSQTLLFMPTTTIDGRTVTFDPLKSKIGKPTTFESLLIKFGYYNWNYDDNIKGNEKGAPKMMMQQKNVNQEDEQSSGSNRLGLFPPGNN